MEALERYWAVRRAWRELQQQGHCEGSMAGVTTNATVPPEKGTWDGGTRGAEAGAR